MTPTEHSAGAAAIAALEEAKREIERERLELKRIDAQGLFAHAHDIAVSKLVASLASLRAVAPAPADDKLPCDVAVAPATIFRAGVETRLVFDAIEMRRKHPNDYPITDSIVARLRPAPADQSDAGRDGVIEACKAIFAKVVSDQVAHIKENANALKGYGDAIANDARCRELCASYLGEIKWCVDFDLRALASAPSETVGRGELQAEVEELRALVGKLNGGAEMQELMRLNNGLADKVRNLTTLLDQQLGTPCEQIRHAQEVERLQALVLPTADRDAIREALKEAREAIGPFARAFDFVDDRIRGEPAFDYRGLLKAVKIGDFRRAEASFAKLTAALGLIGEG